MRALLIVDAEPFFRFNSNLVQSFKDLHVQDLFPVTSIESFDKTVLHRFAGLDEFQSNSVSSAQSATVNAVSSGPLTNLIRLGKSRQPAIRSSILTTCSRRDAGVDLDG